MFNGEMVELVDTGDFWNTSNGEFECSIRNNRSRISLIKQLKNVSRNTLQSLVSLLSF